MTQLLSAFLRLLRRNLLLFVAIVLILASAQWVSGQWRQGKGLLEQLPALQTAQRDVSALQRALDGNLTRQVRQLSAASLGELDAAISSMEQNILVLERAREPVSLPAVALSNGASLTEQLRRQARNSAELGLRRQALAHLVAVREHARVVQNRQGALVRLERLRLDHVQLYAQWRSARQQLLDLEARAGWMAAFPLTSSYRQAQALRQELARLRAANGQAHAAFRAQQAALERLRLPAALPVFQLDLSRHEGAHAVLHTQLQRAETLAGQNLVWRAYQAVRPVLPLALAVLIGWWLLPAAMRTLFYFVLAPLAARCPPVVLARSGAPCRPLISAVSLSVTLAPGDELLCRPEFCQSQQLGVAVTTRLLLDWRHPLTSMAAQLWLLKQLRADSRADVVISSTTDAHDEVAVLDIPAGAAFVLQPRALVGMVVRGGRRPVLRSHWRLGTLHAWLTLQLRYLVFEGPAQLLVKGCRGVRLEQAAAGRTISQDATLGFSVHARYATVRADPFIPYLRGSQPLFHDHFQGDDASFLYEEVPGDAQRLSGTSNPLSVLVDTGLKAFGI